MSFTLHYDGAKFNNNGEMEFHPSAERTPPKKQIDKLNERFSNVGALVMRYHLGHGQRAGLIQQVARQDYEQNSVDSVGQGHDQDDLFKAMFGATPTCQATKRMEQCAHATLGKGKVLNERAQPLLHVNSHNLHGEQHLWAIIHSTVWNTGINFAIQLNHQGFAYIACPNDVTPEEYELINAELRSNSSLQFKGNDVTVGKRTLQITDVSKLVVDLDPEHKHTFQDHGIAISTDTKGEKAPLGWMVHKETGKVVPKDLVVNSACVMRLAKGGFYELTNKQQEILQTGLLRQNGQGLFTQNQAFNAITSICEFFEAEYGFDPDKLMGKSLSTTVTRVREFFKNPVHLEDFLTGPIITEMVQPLRVSRSKSTRRELPLRFTNPFCVTLNNTKAIAYAFDIKDLEGKSVFTPSIDKPISSDSRLIDRSVNGTLATPQLSYGKHAAAVLSTAVLVSEQLLLEQILRTAFAEGSIEAVLKVLKPNHEEGLTQLALNIKMILEDAPKDANGVVLGVQLDYCDGLIKMLRELLNFNSLITLIEILNKPGITTADAINEYSRAHDVTKLEAGLNSLVKLGDMLQSHENTSGLKEGSRGIAAGLVPLLEKIRPVLANQVPTPIMLAVSQAENIEGYMIEQWRTQVMVSLAVSAVFMLVDAFTSKKS